MTERRKNQRFKLRNGQFILHSRKIGKIENISLGGLCCSCVNDDFIPSPEGSIEIRCLRQSALISDLDVRIVQSEITSGESLFNVFVRKCHIVFKSLTEEQNRNLLNFISTHAASLA